MGGITSKAGQFASLYTTAISDPCQWEPLDDNAGNTRTGRGKRGCTGICGDRASGVRCGEDGCWASGHARANARQRGDIVGTSSNIGSGGRCSGCRRSGGSRTGGGRSSRRRRARNANILPRLRVITCDAVCKGRMDFPNFAIRVSKLSRVEVVGCSSELWWMDVEPRTYSSCALRFGESCSGSAAAI